MRSDTKSVSGLRRRAGRARRRVIAALRPGTSWIDRSSRLAHRVRMRIDPRSLSRRAAADNPALGRGDRAFLRDLEATLAGQSLTRMAVIVDERTALLPLWVAAHWPAVQILCLSTSADVVRSLRARRSGRVTIESAPDAATRHALLTAHGRFDAIVDWLPRTPDDRLTTVQDTVFHLRRGGCYVTVAAELGGTETALEDPINQWISEESRSTGAVAAVRRNRHSLVVRCRTTAMPRLRYPEMDRVLAIRPTLGRVLSTLPAATFRSRATVAMNRPNPGAPFAETLSVPSLAIREYHDVTCAPHQVLVAEQILIPDSYRHYLNRTLTNVHTDEVATRFARARRLGPGRELAGTYFYLGSEYPQHFGHVMTEQLSRLWAWPEVKSRFPGARALVDLDRRFDQLRPWEIDIFAAAGVEARDLVAIRGVVRVEKLLAATPMLVNTQYVHPRIREVWSHTAAALAERAPKRSYPDKIFVSRKGSHKKRSCTNTVEVEACFRARGFTIVYPEDYELPEQVMLFRRALVIAGFAGSGLFTMLCCGEPKTVIVLWPETYTSRNEYLIASAMGHHLELFWCAADRRHPEGGWTKKAYQSTYAFDFDLDGARLQNLLARV